MAVLLTRENQDNRPNPSNLPRVTVRNLPVSTPERFQTGIVTGRTSNVYSCDNPGREVFWKSNYERRQSQLSDGGFHGPLGHKYQEVGDVELDDKTLILQGLGQMHTQSLEQTTKKLNLKANNEGDILGPLPTLRARTPSQFPDKLLDLHSELARVDSQLDQVRKGHGLFHMFQDEQKRKEITAKQLAEKQAKAKSGELLQATVQDPQDSSLPSTAQQEQLVSITDEEKTVDEVELSYYKLCVLVWILECMKLESPNYMPSLHSFWQTNKPVIVEEKGRRVYERTVTSLKQWDQLVLSKDSHTNIIPSIKKESINQIRPSSKLERLKNEEQRLRKQKKLSPEQLEKLKQLIEEELNHSKKKSRNSIKQLMEAKTKQQYTPKLPKIAPVPIVTLDTDTVRHNFASVDDDRDMIVHEQLSVMSRERQEALEQRFSSLQVSGNMWTDLDHMRQGVEIETTMMAHNKLMMNYNWLAELESTLPVGVHSNLYCQDLLQQLAGLQQYMRQVGPQKMSQEKLISVLSLLRPWELAAPTIAATIEFIIHHVIYIVPEDYQLWLEYHTKKQLLQ